MAGWHVLGRYWTCSAPSRSKFFLFRCVVYNAVLSGLESRVLLNSEVSQVDTFIVQKLRALLRGAAHTTGMHGEHHTMTNLQVFKRCKICPTKVELVARRITWYQSMSKRPQDNEALITAAFGCIPGLDGYDNANRRTDDYTVDDIQTTFGLQNVADLAMVMMTPEMPGASEIKDLILHQPLKLFYDAFVREHFARFRVDRFRATFVETNILDTMCGVKSNANNRMDADNNKYQCPIRFSDGSQCPRSFFQRESAGSPHAAVQEAGES